MTLRILQAMAGAPQGGAEAFFERLVSALHTHGVQQHVIIRKNQDRAERLRSVGLNPVELPFGGFFDFTTRRKFLNEIKKFQPHVVMTWMNRASGMCPKGDFVHVARLGGYYDLKYYNNCDHLIGNTEDIVSYLVREGWPAERAHYVPNFVHVSPDVAPEPRAKHWTPENAPLIVAMGRLHENKAFDTLIKAVARVPDAYLWLAGEGPEREALEALAQSEGIKPRTRFLGWRNDVLPLLSAADLFVCPSRHEPLGNVVLEAWAQGAPILAADSQGPGMLIDHGRTGLLVPVDDVKSMAQGISWMLENPEARTEMANAAQAEYTRHYSEDVVIDRYRDFFAKVTRSAPDVPHL